MNVVVVGGLCVESDAISSVILNQAQQLQQLPEVESVTIVTHHCSRETDIDVVEVGDAWSLLRLPVIERADLVIFHWGIRYPMFDALAVVAATTRTAVHFHNVTPPELVAEPDRGNIERSIEQIQLLHAVDCEIWTESEFNAETLEAWGIERERVAFMPFPIEPPRVLRPRAPGDTIRVLSVGRLTAAKGADILLDAMTDVVQRDTDPVQLTIVGNLSLSDPEYADTLRARLEHPSLVRTVTVADDVDDDELWDMLEAADLLVSPSLHEGLCVPVIEAYAAGCRVVGTDAGNLPWIIQEPDPIVPAGDATALADAIVAILRELRGAVTSRPPGVDGLLECFSGDSTLQRLHAAVTANSVDRRDYARTSWTDSGISRRTVAAD